ncbi:MAG TPA: hypothetical protein VH678_22405 [Xanthobacteraceae bacterium]|jgi:hypothetical protein
MLRASILAPIALAALIAPASAFDLVVVNEANLSVIHKLYLAPAKSNQWGENKLQSQTIAEKGRFTVRDVPAGMYDLKIIDDDDDSCVVPDINIDQNKEWKVTDKTMLECASKKEDSSLEQLLGGALGGGSK